jgi:choline-glycine betaine transporter
LASAFLKFRVVACFSRFGAFTQVIVALSLATTWSVVLVAVVQPDSFFDNAADAKSWITENFTWFFIGAQNAWVFFVAYIWLKPEYHAMKLGSETDVPEYSALTWFMMMFSTAGTGTGLIFYGVAEPIYHLGYNRYLSRGYLTYDEISQEAINLTYYHWGLHAWLCYTVVGISLGIAANRMGLPLSMRSCFFPILGNMVFGSVGDLIDALAIVTTLFAVCTSMGLGAIQINTGLNELVPSIEKQSIAVQVVLIALMTVIAGLSAHAGLKWGVRVMSIMSFFVLTTLMFATLLADDTSYLLNLLVQSLGDS